MIAHSPARSDAREQQPAAGLPDDVSADARPLRADARRNRDRLVEVAKAAFSERGAEAALEDIARRAGVGVGTLYRHFPTREHLVEAVYRQEVEALSLAAEALARDYPPDRALAEWMQRFVGYIAAKRGMAGSLRLLISSKSGLFSDASGLVQGALHRLVDAAREAGSIRDDVDASDIFHALSGIYNAPDTPEWQDRSRRMIALLMDGLRWGAALPPRP